MTNESKYAKKRRSGNQMYGGASSGSGSCCAHDQSVQHVPKDQYWWGEKREERTVEDRVASIVAHLDAQEEVQEDYCL